MREPGPAPSLEQTAIIMVSCLLCTGGLGDCGQQGCSHGPFWSLGPRLAPGYGESVPSQPGLPFLGWVWVPPPSVSPASAVGTEGLSGLKFLTHPLIPQYSVPATALGARGSQS